MILNTNGFQGARSGIYTITNSVSDKVYIGSAFDFYDRLSQHKSVLNSNRRNHHCAYLQNSWNKYGAKCFEMLIVEPVENLEELYNIEQKWLDTTPPQKKYNMSPYALAGWNRKDVYLFDIKDGKFIGEYRSCAEVAKVISTTSATVSDVCCGRQKSVNGYFISYSRNGWTALPGDYYIKTFGSKAVAMIDKTTDELLMKFSSMAEAAKHIGISRTLISAVCNGIQITAGGYKWKFDTIL